MSLWLNKENDNIPRDLASMTDVIFKIECQSLPVDHAQTLSDALCAHQPWLREIPNIGIHAIHVAGSQNGWQRPESDDRPLLLSRRTRLKIRVPVEQGDRLIQGLQDSDHSIGDHQLHIVQGRFTPLRPATTLFSRHAMYLQSNTNQSDENEFEQRVIADCSSLGYKPTKVLCGRSHHMAIQGESILTRSVMLADVPDEYSLALQEQGLGDHRLIGCGLLIPHKDTDAVS